MSQSKKQQKPSAAKPMSKLAAKLLFAKLVKESKTMDEAWRRVRKLFPRRQWGRVREIAQQLSEHKTFVAAFAAAHARSSRSKQVKRAA